MTLPFGSTAIIDLGHQRWAIQNDQLVALSPLDRIEGPVFCITDFGSALQRVENIATPKRYAAAILEKNLRDRGDTDGASKILLSSTHNIAGTTRALYTAVPAERFNSYWQHASQHSDHYLILPQLSLMLRKAQSLKDKQPVILLQHGYHIDMLVLNEGKPVSVLRVSTAGTEQSDWERTLRFLLSELHHLQSEYELSLKNAYWFDWDPEGVAIPNWICDWLETNTGLRVVQEEAVSLTFNGEVIQSSLPSLLQYCKSTDAVNTAGAHAIFWCERLLPFAAMIMLSVSAALLALGVQWENRSTLQEEQISHLEQQVNRSSLQDISQALAQTAATPGTSNDHEFVQRLHQAANMPPLPHVLADIRSLIPQQSRITGLQLDLSNDTPVLVLEGWISSEPVIVNRMLQRLINDLNGRGYQVKDNGILAQKQRSLFQLELSLKESRNEI